MKWSRGWHAALLLALAGLLAAVYLNFGSDGTSETILLTAAHDGQSQMIGAAIGVALTLAVCSLAFVMFETNLIGNFVVILICAAWLVKLYFWG